MQDAVVNTGQPTFGQQLVRFAGKGAIGEIHQGDRIVECVGGRAAGMIGYLSDMDNINFLSLIGQFLYPFKKNLQSGLCLSNKAWRPANDS